MQLLVEIQKTQWLSLVIGNDVKAYILYLDIILNKK